ncbi:MAG: hypothetical protein JW876_02815 [Candidatus Krumholzibacteriota bacterium]|nr:hypothetical protein [Candidatus Krumholzibacteriota bacterium]
MTRRIAFLVALLVLVATASQARVIYSYHGKGGRRAVRYANLADKWEGDKLRIYRENGFPVHRIREYGYGRVTEHWTYYELGKEFVFDENSTLVKTRSFWPENRRERFERK